MIKFRIKKVRARFCRLVLVALASALALGEGSLRAWDDTGHQIVAAIAWTQLEPAVKEKLLLLFPEDPQSKNHIIFFPSPKGSGEGIPARMTYNLVTVANWMDDIRADSAQQPLSDWHCIFTPYFDGIPARYAIAGSPNVREKVMEQLSLLAKFRDFDKTFPGSGEVRAKAAYCVAELYHMIGDLHQPLHCISRYSEALPDGDRAATMFPLQASNASTLHAYWDSTGGLFDFYKLGRGTEPDYKQKLGEFVKRVLARWDPETHPEWKKFNPDEWVNESYELSKEKVYPGIAPRGVPDEAYREKTQQLCAERIGTAGYRLALVLNAILGSKAGAN